VRGLLAGGETYGAVWGLGSAAKRIEAGATLDLGAHVGGTLLAAVDLGATREQLQTDAVTLAATIDLLVGRLRLGVGPKLTYFWMDRAATSSPFAVDAFGPGLRASVTLDVARFDDRFAIFAGASAQADSIRGTRALLDVERGAFAWRAGGVLGLRF